MPVTAWDGDSSYIKGATDDTQIGNVLDALKVALSGTAPEAEYATFTVLTQAVATANNKSMISLLNASGSTVKLKLRDFRVINTQNTAVTGVVVDLNLYRCTGHSAGTSLTPLAFDTTDTLNSSITARTGATIAGEVTSALLHLDLSSDEWGPGAQDVETNDHTQQSLHSFYYTRQKTKPITLNAGEGLTLKCITNTTTGSYDIQVIFTQE
jgi:hypothetical protein